MANINSLSSSNSYQSSIYGSKNIISGLATGMDTESMIENSVQPYQTKITELQQQQERITWKQDAIREIIDPMNSIIQKYTSYTSTTNLSSNSFFTKSMKTEASGTNASAITATGKATSDIQLNAVTQLATAARYSVGADKLGFSNTVNMTGSAVDAVSSHKTSTIAGSLSLTLGSTKFDLDFSEDEVYESEQELVDAINSKLEEQKADIKAELSDGKLTFTVTGTAKEKGDSVFISGASGNFKTELGVQYTSKSDPERFTNEAYRSISIGGKTLQTEKTAADYLSNKTVEVTLNGVTKKISTGDVTSFLDEDNAAIENYRTLKENADNDFDKNIYQKYIDDATTKAIRNKLVANLNEGLKTAFGDGAVTVKEEEGGLAFDVKQNSGSSLLVKSDTEALGIGTGLSNYFNTSRTLGSLLGEDYFKAGEGDNTYYEEKELVINGVNLGSFGKDAALDQVMNAINASAEGGAKVSFSRLTNEFVFTSAGTGAGQEINFGDGLASRLFDNGAKAAGEAAYTAGQDAEVRATVNGKEITLSRSSNVIDMDGMSVTLKSTFTAATEEEAVTFKTTADSDKVVDTIKSFVTDINKLMEDIHKAYTTQPLKKSKSATALATSKSGTNYYMPLTEKDKEGMSESAIKSYEEKAKQGLLFQDSDMSTLYDKLRSALAATGTDRLDMEAIGLTTTYSNGVTTLSLDEDKLRAALEGDPDKVRTVFTKTIEGGSSSNGLIERLKAPLKAYGSTSLGSQGVLVRKAGTKLSSVSMLNNTLQSQINDYDTQIEKWQAKMSDKIDYYTKQFTALEKLMSTMNNQSSMLSQMMGY